MDYPHASSIVGLPNPNRREDSQEPDMDTISRLPDPINVLNPSFSLPEPISAGSSNPVLELPSLDEDLGDDSSLKVPEALFPSGKIAELQKKLDGSGSYIGLEYVIEIQHNTIKKMDCNYVCLLCDVHVKSKNNSSSSTTEMIKIHLKSGSHKLKYMVSY